MAISLPSEAAGTGDRGTKSAEPQAPDQGAVMPVSPPGTPRSVTPAVALKGGTCRLHLCLPSYFQA